MVLVWPRSTEPLEGSMVKPLCCRDVPLSRLNSTVCGTLELQLGWRARHSSQEAVGLGSRGLTPPALSALTSRLPTPYQSRGKAGRGPGRPGRGAAEGLGGPGQCCGHLLWGQLGGPDAAHLQLSGGRWGRCFCV